ncbi:hypothetical protein ACFPRL_22855 [Pseudoclavibacter helvolus]
MQDSQVVAQFHIGPSVCLSRSCRCRFRGRHETGGSRFGAQGVSQASWGKPGLILLVSCYWAVNS